MRAERNELARQIKAIDDLGELVHDAEESDNGALTTS
jgi:hypothetical protein